MDNHHVRISPSVSSCGILELSGLTSDADKMMYAIASYLYHPSRGSPAAYLSWSDVDQPRRDDCKGSNGWELNLVFQCLTPSNPPWEVSAENPVTGNFISWWGWEIQHTEFKEWYIKKRTEKAAKL